MAGADGADFGVPSAGIRMDNDRFKDKPTGHKRLGKADSNRTMPSAGVWARSNNAEKKFNVSGRGNHPGASRYEPKFGEEKTLPSVTRRAINTNPKLMNPEITQKADSFPNDKENPLLEGYSKSRRLQEIQKADPTWLSEDKASQRQNTWPSKDQGDILKAQPVTPAPVKPMSPPTPKAIQMPAMRKNVPNLTKKSRLPGTPAGDALQAAFPKTQDVAAPKVKMPSQERTCTTRKYASGLYSED